MQLSFHWNTNIVFFSVCHSDVTVNKQQNHCSQYDLFNPINVASGVGVSALATLNDEHLAAHGSFSPPWQAKLP